MIISVKNIGITALLTLALGLFMTAYAQNSSYANSSVSSLAGTSWTVVETDGDNDIFNFLADGSLHYWDGKKSYTNGTWKQDGDSIYIEMNNKFVEYKGRISGTHIEGKAWNVKGHNWTWVADRKSQMPPTP